MRKRSIFYLKSIAATEVREGRGEVMPAKSSRAAALRAEEMRGSKDRAGRIKGLILSADALDDRIAIVGTAGSGKTYAAKGFVERLLESGARVAIVDPLGVWWGLRAGGDGAAPGYPVVVFGGRHADVPITAEMIPTHDLFKIARLGQCCAKSRAFTNAPTPGR